MSAGVLVVLMWVLLLRLAASNSAHVGWLFVTRDLGYYVDEEHGASASGHAKVVLTQSA